MFVVLEQDPVEDIRKGGSSFDYSKSMIFLIDFFFRNKLFDSIIMYFFRTKVKLEEKEASIFYDPNIVEANYLKNEIENLGYQATLLSNHLSSRFFITGMKCNNCVNKVQSKVGELPGVKDVKVSSSGIHQLFGIRSVWLS